MTQINPVVQPVRGSVPIKRDLKTSPAAATKPVSDDNSAIDPNADRRHGSDRRKNKPQGKVLQKLDMRQTSERRHQNGINIDV